MGMVPALTTGSSARWAGGLPMRFWGWLSCAILPLLALIYRNRPEDIGQRPDGIDAPTAKTSGAPVIEKAHDLAFAIRTRAIGF